MTKLNFPIYRKYSNDKSFFKVESEIEFIQLQVIGTRVIEQQIHVKQYPEMMLVRDLIASELEHIQESTEREFDTISKQNLNLK